tara:strand:- start:10 stop:762 length:753 start_codon:yes stop_codon:yes gene_type:complete
MKNSIDIYWEGSIETNNNGNINNDLLFNSPKPLLQYLKKTYPLSPLRSPNPNETSPVANYFQCPAATNYLKNIYIIESPVDFTLEIDKNNPKNPIMFYCALDMLKLRSFIDSFFELSYFCTFFTEEKNLKIELINPSFHNTDFSRNTTIFEGSYNIGKWFRGIHPNFVLHKSKINVKKGEPLYYIKFNTDKNIKFKNYNLSPELIKLESNNVKYKHIISKTPLSKLYSLFISKNYHKRILKEIKNNLTGY